mmetsp:Transcript_11409/g.40476  ORF Transcript_11409/g.40476 Transcript_11409/m.40476 type:complete len:402 (-) Transcript_11409:1315-2520(-)
MVGRLVQQQGAGPPPRRRGQRQASLLTTGQIADLFQRIAPQTEVTQLSSQHGVVRLLGEPLITSSDRVLVGQQVPQVLHAIAVQIARLSLEVVLRHEPRFVVQVLSPPALWTFLEFQLARQCSHQSRLTSAVTTDNGNATGCLQCQSQILQNGNFPQLDHGVVNLQQVCLIQKDIQVVKPEAKRAVLPQLCYHAVAVVPEFSRGAELKGLFDFLLLALQLSDLLVVLVRAGRFLHVSQLLLSRLLFLFERVLSQQDQPLLVCDLHHIVGVVSREGFELAVVNFDNISRACIQEGPVVRHSDDDSVLLGRICAPLSPQMLLQPQHAMQIQMVRRLVQQQHIRLAVQHPRQGDAHAPAARELPNRPSHHRRVETQPPQRLLGPVLGLVGMYEGESLLDLREAA